LRQHFNEEEIILPQKKNPTIRIASRFRGLLPVVVDVETSGLNPNTHALLEIAIVTLGLGQDGRFYRENTFSYHVEPYIGAEFDQESLALTGIDPSYPLRFPIPEKQALHNLFTEVTRALEKTGCQRAILVGHNAWFDLAVLQAARKRCHFKTMPFHAFTTLDTATLSAFALGETVLAKALRASHIPFDVKKAHSAIYDAERTAELFCYILNNR
jgi:ribonuclease T